MALTFISFTDFLSTEFEKGNFAAYPNEVCVVISIRRM